MNSQSLSGKALWPGRLAVGVEGRGGCGPGQQAAVAFAFLGSSSEPAPAVGTVPGEGLQFAQFQKLLGFNHKAPSITFLGFDRWQSPALIF